MTDTKSEYARFAEIVAAVKGRAAMMTGDEVTWEIQSQWAKANGRDFAKPKPEPLKPTGALPMEPEAPVGHKPKLPPLPDEQPAKSRSTRMRT